MDFPQNNCHSKHINYISGYVIICGYLVFRKRDLILNNYQSFHVQMVMHLNSYHKHHPITIDVIATFIGRISMKSSIIVKFVHLMLT